MTLRCVYPIIYLLISNMSYGVSNNNPKYIYAGDIKQAVTLFFNNNLAHSKNTDNNALDSDYELSIGKIDSRLKRQACNKLTVTAKTLPLSSGRNTLKVSCMQANVDWSLHIPINIKIFKVVLFSQNPINVGQAILATDITSKRIDITYQQHYLTNATEIKGFTAKRSLTANQLLKSSWFSPPMIINKGQEVTIKSTIGSIMVSTPGIALINGQLGKRIQVRNKKTKEVVEGIVIAAGIINVNL